MKKNQNDVVIVKGIVVEALPNTQFKVQISSPQKANTQAQNQEENTPVSATPTPEDVTTGDEGVPIAEAPKPEIVLVYLAGKMRLHKIRVVVGDMVEMQMDPYGGRPRIIRRL